MTENSKTYPVEVMCQVLEVSKSGYYAQGKDGKSPRAEKRQRLVERMWSIHEKKHGTYGSPRMYRELRAEGEQIGENTISRWMKAAGIRARRRRRWVPKTTETKPGDLIVENRLQQDFKTQRANEKWVSDITYVWTEEGWLYLAAVMDLYSRKVVGWSMGTDLKTELVKKALEMALKQRNPKRGLLHHSDRGTQYASREYEALTKAYGIERSMSRSGNCYDNAAMESFFSTLKTEWVNDRKYATREECRRSIFEYIEVFYNRQRRHSAIGYISPEEYENLCN